MDQAHQDEIATGAGAATASSRLEMLAGIGTVLGSSLDTDSTLRQLAQLVVPRLADWCFVEMPAADGRIEAVVVEHEDPAGLAFAREIMARYPLDPDSGYGTPHVLRTGEPVLMPDITDDWLAAAAQDDEHLQLLRQAGLRSMIMVPLAVPDRVLGVLTLVMGESGRRFSPADLEFVQDIARRAALAVDNSRLYAQEREARLAAERAADRSRRLHALAAALNEAATLEQVAEACVEHGRAALDADRGMLARLVEDGSSFEVLHSTYAADVANDYRHFPVQAGRPLSDALLQRRPVLIGSRADCAALYPHLWPEFARSETLAFAAIPVITANRPLAALSFSFRGPRQFPAEDHTFLMTLGEQAAQALERARLLEAEKRARSEAESANRAKSEFLSAMSHELRTPLNAIGGYVDLLDAGVRGPLNEAQLKDLERIRKAQALLVTLITDILNFARIEAGRIEIRPVAVPVSAVLEDLRSILGPQVRDRELTAEFAGVEGLAVQADPERLQQVMINLLTNAVKFTQRGGRVDVGARQEGAHVAITVADTGRGIAPDKLEAIFEPFIQLNRGTLGGSQHGVGLGLAISRELARAMGGDLVVASEPGVGSVFTLRLPAAVTPWEPAPPAGPSSPTPG